MSSAFYSGITSPRLPLTGNTSKVTTTMVAAPLLGLAVDLIRARSFGGAFWPVGALGAAVALVFFLTALKAGGKDRLLDLSPVPK